MQNNQNKKTKQPKYFLRILAQAQRLHKILLIKGSHYTAKKQLRQC